MSGPPPAARGLIDATVMANAPLCREHWRLTLGVADYPPTEPGQFVQVACGPSLIDVSSDAEWPPFGAAWAGDSGVPLLRRPFSLAGRRDADDGVILELILRTVGVGTHYLAGLKPGDTVNLLGPLGRGFAPTPPGGLALLVGGGVGIPPMLYLAERFGVGGSWADGPEVSATTSAGDAADRRPTRAVAFCGATTRALLPLTIIRDAPAPASDTVAPRYNVAEFARHGVPAVVSTDDGSYGYRGFVTDPLAAYLDAWITDQADRARTVVYACGPEPMLHRVAEVARRRGVACQVCVERAMACGLGTCQSCCVRVKKPDPAAPPMAGSDWCYRLACTDGPVFDAQTLLW